MDGSLYATTHESTESSSNSSDAFLASSEQSFFAQIARRASSIGVASSDDASLHSAEEEETRSLWFCIIGAAICVFTAALAAGLTMGLMSLNILELKIKIASGSEVEKKRARIVLPVCKY
jgi:hypothetical protein